MNYDIPEWLLSVCQGFFVVMCSSFQELRSPWLRVAEYHTLQRLDLLKRSSLVARAQATHGSGAVNLGGARGLWGPGAGWCATGRARRA